jgi:N-acyl homoserine lactone hydrolase
MSDLTIWPIRMAVSPGGDKSGCTLGMNHGVKLDTAIIVYVIKGAKENIIVDTGMGDPEWSEKYHHRKLVQYQTLEAGLQKLGLRPDDVKVVICTHLHWDHSFNNVLFRKARILVQKEEIRYAIAPLPAHALFMSPRLSRCVPPGLRRLSISNLSMET